MVRHTFKILQQMLQDFYSVSDHFMTLRSKGLIPPYAQERSTLHIVHLNLNELSGRELEHFKIRLYFSVYESSF